MKKSFATLAAILVALCATSTALAETQAPASGEAQKTAIPGMPQLHYSMTRADVYAPIIIRKSNDVTVHKGEIANLHVIYEGNPTPTTIISYKDKLLNLESSKYALRSDTYFTDLTIRNVQIEDSGTYIFTVKNMMGEAEVYINVYVI